MIRKCVLALALLALAGCLKTEDEQREPGPQIKVLCADYPKEPFQIRGECSLNDTYYGEWSGRYRDFYSFRIYQHGSFPLYLYIERNSADGPRLFSLLSQGDKKLTVEAQFSSDVHAIEAAKLLRVVSWE